MAGQLKVSQIQLGDSATATNNFVLQTALDGTAKLSRGNVGATTQDVLTVGADGLINTTKQLTMGTAQATTSGTSFDFTGIPSWAKRITVMLRGISTNGTSFLMVKLGNGSIVSTGYSYAGGYYGVGSYNSILSTACFTIVGGGAPMSRSGSMVLNLQSNNTWIATFTGATVTGDLIGLTGGGSVALSGTLDRLRLTTANGTDVFDAGSVNVMWEG